MGPSEAKEQTRPLRQQRQQAKRATRELIAAEGKELKVGSDGATRPQETAVCAVGWPLMITVSGCVHMLYHLPVVVLASTSTSTSTSSGTAVQVLPHYR